MDYNTTLPIPDPMPVAWLKQFNPCQSELSRFRKMFGGTVSLTRRHISKAVHAGFDFEWFAQRALTTQAYKVFEEATAPAYKVWEEAKAQAYKVFEEATAQADKVLKEAKAQALYDILQTLKEGKL